MQKWFILAGPKLDFIADNDNDGFSQVTDSRTLAFQEN